MTAKQLAALGIAGDCSVAPVHQRVLDIGVSQPVLHEADIGSGVQHMHRNRVAQRMKPPLGLREVHMLTEVTSPSSPDPGQAMQVAGP